MVDEAKRNLRRYRTITEKHEEYVLAAHKAGMSLREIAELSGLHRTTVKRIIDRKKGEGSDSEV